MFIIYIYIYTKPRVLVRNLGFASESMGFRLKPLFLTVLGYEGIYGILSFIFKLRWIKMRLSEYKWNHRKAYDIWAAIFINCQGLDMLITKMYPPQALSGQFALCRTAKNMEWIQHSSVFIWGLSRTIFTSRFLSCQLPPCRSRRGLCRRQRSDFRIEFIKEERGNKAATRQPRGSQVALAIDKTCDRNFVARACKYADGPVWGSPHTQEPPEISTPVQYSWKTSVTCECNALSVTATCWIWMCLVSEQPKSGANSSDCNCFVVELPSDRPERHLVLIGWTQKVHNPLSVVHN